MKFLLLCFFITIPLFARVINFSPLPMDKAPKLFIQYKPLLEYLSKETGYEFKFTYSSNYNEIIDKFTKGELDIIELGPLPFVKLKDKYKDAKAFLTFLSKKKKSYYRCECITTDNDIKTLEDLKKLKRDIKLTRKISTCGYLMSEYMLKKTDQTLENFNYEYVGTHSNVLLEILLKNNTIGCAKSTVIEKYNNFHFNILKQSPKIPGFAFIANLQTLSSQEIKKIQDAMLKLKPFQNKKDKQLMSHWSINVKYGAIKTKPDAYNTIYEAIKNIDIPKKDK